MSDYIKRGNVIRLILRILPSPPHMKRNWDKWYEENKDLVLLNEEVFNMPQEDVVDAALFDRARTLLKATYELLNKQAESNYVLNILSETAFYDDAECDGNCLMEDIDGFFWEIDRKGLKDE